MVGIDKIERIEIDGIIRTFLPPTPISQRKSIFEGEIFSKASDTDEELNVDLY